MDWMEETRERRADPHNLWREVRSVIVFGLNYGPDSDPTGILEKQGQGRDFSLCPATATIMTSSRAG